MFKRFQAKYLLPIIIFLSGFEYLFNITIGSVDVRAFHLLILFFSYSIFSSKKAVKAFLVLNVFLILSIVNYSFLIGTFHSEYLKVVLHQELFIISLSFFISFEYSDESLRNSYLACYFTLFINSIIGLVQFIGYNLYGFELSLSQHEMMGDHLKWRVYGFFSEPNAYSVYFSFALVFIISGIRSMKVVYKILFLLPVGVSLFLSFSRGAILSLVILLVVYLLKERSLKKIMPYFAIAFVIGLTLFFGMRLLGDSEALYRITSFDVTKDPSSSQRLDDFIAILNYMDSNEFIENLYGFLFGNGLSSFREIIWYPKPYNYFAMNIYVDLIFEFGIIPFIIFVIILIRLFNSAKSKETSIIKYEIILIFIIGLFYPIRSLIPFQIPLIMSVGILLKSYIKGDGLKLDKGELI